MSSITINKSVVEHKDVLKNKALMVRLTRKKFNRNKTDKALSEELTKLKGVAEAGAVRVNKSLFTKEVTDGYMKVYSEASKYFYRVTLPWDDKGYRLLSIDIFDEFSKKFKQFSNDYRKHVAKFIDEVENHVETARAMLGEAFDLSDYSFISTNGGVDQDFLLAQFELGIEYDVVTSGDDLRAVLTEADREAVAAQIDAMALERFGKAQAHVVQTLHDHIFAIHERLCESENIFRDTLITNLQDLVDLIPKMNIAGDPAIDELAAEAKLKLCQWDPQELREDPEARKDVDQAAKDILGNMEGMI
jgi:hypothetical protein